MRRFAIILVLPLLAVAADLHSPQYRHLETFGSKNGIHPPKLMNRRAANLAFGDSDFPYGIGYPAGVATDASGRVWITDGGTHSVHVFSPSGEYREIKRAGGASFQQPEGIAADSAGRIYISDAELGDIFVFDEKGEFDRSLIPRKSGRVLERPGALAIAENGATIFVLDPPRNAVVALDREGEAIATITMPQELTRPKNISIVDNQLWILDELYKVAGFSPAGKSRGTLHWDTVRQPVAFAFDSYRRRYLVADAQWMAVRIFTEEGKEIGAFGKRGDGLDEMQRIDALSVDPQGRIFIVDSGSHKVLVFSE